MDREICGRSLNPLFWVGVVLPISLLACVASSRVGVEYLGIYKSDKGGPEGGSARCDSATVRTIHNIAIASPPPGVPSGNGTLPPTWMCFR